jgi:signal transduction histidine kinase
MTFPMETESVARFFFIVALGLFIGMAAWVGRGFAGNALRPLALPLATAAMAPMLLSPVWDTGDSLGVTAAIVLPALATLALVDGFVARITIPRARRVAVAVALTASVVIPAGAVMIALRERASTPLADLAFLVNLANALTIGVTLVTAAAIVVSTSRLDPGQSTSYRLDRLPILMAAVTPIVTAASVSYLPFGFGIGVPLIWLLVVVVVLQTNARVEVLRLQRDTVVAATEAERARLAADLHDDALQEMTVLIRRLDDEGSAADAEIARSIADRLRDVCGDLRLPILDELGAGPALEWLVERVAQASGGEVRLQRADVARPPADVELAFFRIAQEALSNAVNHGSPPIRVEYRASADEAALSITDNGSGIPADSAALAPRSGHYGLLNMRQRADQIGARIEFGRGAGGGTSIGLRWAHA